MDDHASTATEGAPGPEEEHIHLPGPSVWPFMLALFLFVAMVGLLFFPHFGSSAGIGQWIATGVITLAGAVGVGWSIVAWGIQISEA